jgi:hypothetical protein
MSLSKRLFVFSLAVMFLLSGALNATGQSRTGTVDPEFNTFWIKVKAAVARNDKAAVADMTKLPFMLDSKDLDRAGFIKQYSSLFTPRIRRCFARARPTRDQDSMEIFCGQQIFLFAKADGVYKFTEIGVND